MKTKTYASINLILKKSFLGTNKLIVCVDDDMFVTLKSGKKTKIATRWPMLSIRVSYAGILFGSFHIMNFEKDVRDIEIKQSILGSTTCHIIYKDGHIQKVINTSNDLLLVYILLAVVLSWL